MGNTVVFALRSDKLHNIEGLSFEDLTSGMGNGHSITRFFGAAKSPGSLYSNVIDGVAVSHCAHYSDKRVIYIDNNIMHGSSLLEGLESKTLNLDDVISYVKKTSKYMLGKEPFSVTRQRNTPPVQSVDPSFSRVYLFGFKTDNLHDIDSDHDAVANIIKSIRNNDLTLLNRNITPLAVILNGEAMLVKMHQGTFYRKMLPTALEMNELSLIKNNGDVRADYHDLAFSIDFLNSLGFSLKPMKKNIVSHGRGSEGESPVFSEQGVSI